MFSAVIAVNPAIESEFVDENAMAEMPIGLQQTIKGRHRANLRGLVQGQVTFNTYIVWGTKYDLDVAINRWGADLIIMGAWNPDGTRSGTKKVAQYDGETFLGYITEGEPTFPLHAELLNILDDKVTFTSEGVEVSRTRPSDVSHLPVVLGHKSRQL